MYFQKTWKIAMNDILYSLSDPLITKQQIEEKVRSLADRITHESAGFSSLHLIGVLKGSFIFLADLARALSLPVTLDFIQVSSYGSQTKGDVDLKFLKDLTHPIEGKDVILVEDIIDSGRTIQKLKEILLKKNPKSLRICTLLDKPSRRESPVTIDWVGFSIPDAFVVGYGLDVNENFRNLPYIAEAISLKE